jgi:hypothetical protein
MTNERETQRRFTDFRNRTALSGIEKLRKMDTVLVRIPSASHSIASRPSRLVAKAAQVPSWFENHNASNRANSLSVSRCISIESVSSIC